MLKFNTIGQIEHKYAFEDAVIDNAVFNGAFGNVVDGKFEPKAGASKAIMQIENGDDMCLPKFKINAGSHVRVVDLEAFVGENVEIYDYPLPDEVKVGDSLVSDVNGRLVVQADPEGLSLKVERIIGNKAGVEATVVKN